MKYAILLPPGCDYEVTHADVDEPTVVELGQLEAWAKRERLRRELAELDAALGSTPAGRFDDPYDTQVPAAAFVEAPVSPVEAFGAVGAGDQSFRTRERVLSCPCGRGYPYSVDEHDQPVDQLYAQEITGLYRQHLKRCGTAISQANLDGFAEPGEFKNGLA